jgi:peptidoglycan/xylan/chitin deacetylase (PgdA/CDA1 family)
MICLTGDIHHDSLRTNEQKFNPDRSNTEVKIACRFVEMLEKHNLKSTLYITGKCFKEELEDLKPIIQSQLVEIGGHSYDGLPLGRLAQLGYRLKGRKPPSHKASYGSERIQRRDITKTINIIRIHTTKPVLSWRNHGYVHDDTTYRLLYEHGVRNVSDDIRKDVFKPYIATGGLFCHPINVMPDHDHIYHAHRNKEFVDKARKAAYGADEFGDKSYTIDEWGRLLIQQVDRILKEGGVATILMHPICMYLADSFKTADTVMRYISGYKTIWAKDIRSLLEKEV